MGAGYRVRLTDVHVHVYSDALFPVPTIGESHAERMRPTDLPLSGQRRRAARAAVAVAVDVQVAARAAAFPHPHPALAGVRGLRRGVLRRRRLRRSLPAPSLRLQPRGHALVLAGRLLRLRRERHRPLPTVLPGRRAVLPGPSRGRLSRASAQGPGVGRMVDRRPSPVPDRRGLHGRGRDRRGRLARRWDLGRLDRPVGAGGGRVAAGPRQLSALDLRPGARPRPLGAPGRGLRPR